MVRSRLAPLVLLLSAWLVPTAAPADEPPLPPSESAPVSSEPTAAAPAQSAGSCRYTAGAALVSDFFALTPPLPSLSQILGRDNAQIEVLLAAVPEPRLGFDGTVEAMAHAVEATGYTLDRYYLPWTQRAERGRPPCQEQQPGVALFVSPPEAAAGRRRLLLLYLIGESPTSGAYHSAFLRAIQDQRDLAAALPADRCLDCGRVRLLGPAFSGGAASLEQLLEHPLCRDLPFTILSGRATDHAIQPLLSRHRRPGRPVDFHATQIPDEALQTEFFCYLTETLGADDHDIALLTESTTVFGQAAARLPPASPGSPAHPPTAPGKSHRCRHPHHPRLSLPVPLHISRLNAAWAAHDRASSRPSEMKDVLVPFEQGLSLSLTKAADTGERTDIIPALSPASVASTDRALATILTSIAAEKVRYVGLVFTDVQDTLFLAEQVRKFCPDVQLFTFESDLLYSHPDARPILKGMLTVSAYPLFTRNQQWSWPFRGYDHRLQFARDSDQGVYNAALSLLGHDELLLEYSQPVSKGDPQPDPRPPIWINAVGIDGLFPLVFVPDYDDHGFVHQAPHSQPAEHLYAPYQQGTLSALLTLLGLSGLAFAAGYFRCYYADRSVELRFPWTLFRIFSPYRVRRTPAQLGSHEAARQPLFALALFGPMALLYPLFTTVHFIQLRDGNRGLEAGVTVSDLPLWLRILHHSSHIAVYEGLTWRVLLVGLCSAACQIVFAVAALDVLLHGIGRGQRLRGWLRRTWQRRPRLTVGLSAALFIFLTLFAFRVYVAIVNQLQYDFNHLVFLRRAAHPGFGLSPLTPLLILVSALQLWGYCNLQRIRLLERLTSVVLDLIEEMEHESKLRAHIEAIALRLESPGLFEVGLSLAIAFGLVCTIFSEVSSLEHYSLNFFFRLLLSVLCVMIVYAAYRFLWLWVDLSRFLDLVAHHPLALALSRIPEPLARSIGSLFLEELPEQARHEAERAHFRLLANHLGQLELEAELEKLSSVDAAAMRPMFASLREVLTAPRPQGSAHPPGDDPRLVQSSRILVHILKTFWRARPLPGTLPDPSSLPAQTSTAGVYAQAMPHGLLLWLRLAEDFIAIQVVAYIQHLFPHLRNALVFFTGGLLLLLAAVITYPFQPQHFLILIMWALILGGVGLAVFVLFRMNRNETLSRIAKTEPGRVTVDRRFVSQLVLYGILPLLSLLATQFPEVRGFAFSWVETILKTLK